MSCDSRQSLYCSAASDLYSPGSAVFFNLILRSLIEPICIPSLIIMCVAVKNTSALHFNVRCLLICMLVSMVVSNIGVLSSSIRYLYIVLFLDETNKCEALAYSPSVCSRIRQLWSAGGIGVAVSTLFIAFERLLATLRFRNYEEVPIRWFGFLLCGLQILTAISPIILNPPMPCLPFCSDELVNPERSRMLSKLFFALNFLSLLSFICLYLMNHKKKVDIMHGALSRKFQLKENVTTTKLMIPVMIVVAVMTFPATAIIHLHLPVLDYTNVTTDTIDTIVTFARFYEFQASLMPLLSILMLCLLPYFSSHIRKSFYTLCSISAKSPDGRGMRAEQVKDLYFVQLQGQWEIIKKEKRRGSGSRTR